MENWDVVILGAGAAGLFCGGSLRELAPHLRVLLLDHASRAGEKIRISGGGRCNFTNLATQPSRFHSANPRFAASALAGYTPEDFVALVERAGIAWHEKTAGQLFCDGKSTQIIGMLHRRMAGVEMRLGVAVEGVAPRPNGFKVSTSSGAITASRVVLATGGKSIPKMGASPVGYAIAESLGLRLTETRPGLVPMTFAEQDLDLCRPLAGISVEATVTVGRTSFRDALLFTHRGLSGPVILQASSLWLPGQPVVIDLAPDAGLAARLREARGATPRRAVATVLGSVLPERLAQAIAGDGDSGARIGAMGNAAAEALAARVHRWQIRPVGTEGYRTAEVTMGGVDTRDLDARTLQVRKVPGLHIIGELVDVTGWLGGYNFQWAWASAHAAAKAIAAG
ncbi:aminoacetone oxidase family FAD-binding enzyme [Paracoccus suum]|uniref:Aminoacetone oxidase family FAD-binding enzyme n=1 Tax=Paracoccus suum TaxID=2259340 RepID=A0A344PM95_9RHOB|nr:aminoacetone oxidase family FAD-binding enzyme [Paracoccus suum]AXC50500.1 aminoacetone oxidase family FAD-binding enzyme [Paracoccus suum]